MLENLLNSTVLSSLAITLLHFLWQGLLVATVLKSALLIFNKHKPQLRYALSGLAMLANLLLPIITFIIIYQGELSSSNSLVQSFVLNELILELKKPDALLSYKQLTETLPLLLPYLSILWLATITLLAGKLLIEISTVNRLPQQSTVEPSNQLQTRFNELVDQINLKITPQLLISLKVEVPMAIGWLKPIVLLPASMISGLNNAQLEMLILHELAHIRRHDYLVNFLQTLIEILLFFHPAVWWVSKQMRNEREYCSDDIAVQHCGDAIAYSHTLADIASLCTKTHNHTIPDMAMAASGGDLKQRVTRLVGHHCAPNNNISKWFASATIIFSVLLLSSKQLLTMPLLNIWHNKPWSQATNSINKPTITIEKDLVSNNSLTNNLSSTSIAKELLAPQTLTYQSEKHNKAHNKTDNKTDSKVDNKIANKIDSIASITEVENNKNSSTKQPTSSSEPSQFSTQLDNLSANISKPKETINSAVSRDSLMVEKAFERTNTTDTTNKYHQQLASLQSDKITPSKKSSNITNHSPHAALLNNPSDNIQSHSNVDTPETILKAAEPTWHHATQVESADPIYPSIAKRKGIEIEVKVNFTIDINGQAKDIKFPHQNKISYFKSSIRTAINKWRFLPAKVDDQPVESQMTKVFIFSMQ